MKLFYYQDPGHGWIKVSNNLLNKLAINDKISSYSYMRKDYAYGGGLRRWYFIRCA